MRYPLSPCLAPPPPDDHGLISLLTACVRWLVGHQELSKRTTFIMVTQQLNEVFGDAVNIYMSRF